MPSSSPSPLIEVFVWGPGYGLASLDAECNAIVGLFSTLPNLNWKLYSHYNPSLVCVNSGSVTEVAKSFPCVRNGSALVSGFSAICRYMTRIGQLPSSMTERDRGVVIALSSLLDSKARLLIDLFLYATIRNYDTTTRPAYTQNLPTYINYLYPSQIQKAAELHAQSCGFQSFSRGTFPSTTTFPANPFEATPPQQTQLGSLSQDGGPTQGTSGLAALQKSVLTALRSDRHHVDGALLTTATCKVFLPLQTALSGSLVIFPPSSSSGSTPTPTAIDFLTFGYLSLMYYPGRNPSMTTTPETWVTSPGNWVATPDPWLTDILTEDYPKLVLYLENMKRIILDHNKASPLPWSSNPPGLLPPTESFGSDDITLQEGSTSKGSSVTTRLSNVITPIVSSIWEPVDYYLHALVPKLHIKLSEKTASTNQDPEFNTSPISDPPSLPRSSVITPPPLSPASHILSSLLSTSTAVGLFALYFLVSHHFWPSGGPNSLPKYFTFRPSVLAEISPPSFLGGMMAPFVRR